MIVNYAPITTQSYALDGVCGADIINDSKATYPKFDKSVIERTVIRLEQIGILTSDTWKNTYSQYYDVYSINNRVNIHTLPGFINSISNQQLQEIESLLAKDKWELLDYAKILAIWGNLEVATKTLDAVCKKMEDAPESIKKMIKMKAKTEENKVAKYYLNQLLK